MKESDGKLNAGYDKMMINNIQIDIKQILMH